MTTNKYAQTDGLNFYELALLLADGQAQDNKDGSWADFIDNLSLICDEFAYNIPQDEKPPLNSLKAFYRSYSNA